ncbi:erythromycin esterase family protein [Rufibacter immobilis]|uniref:Erythromycin esterase family protein n=1 Tax=Rufibacter immobilis TaxID=1348778 RepID=A0A3M9MV81_9BACT|nr:erythromycin esterase family protein [Rufibacter immobilis]RNI29441.1 erythromycin esterase family protein [Rufibacter immobilis]
MQKRTIFKIIFCLLPFISDAQTKSYLNEEEKRYLLNFIYPLSSIEPDFQSNEDLKVLDKLIGDSKVVALGEVTHGSSEIYKMKDRIVRYLAQNNHFDIFALEAAMPEAHAMNQYTFHSQGDPKALLKGMHFWIWQTEEMLSLIHWMKTYNDTHARKIHYTGFDMQSYEGALKNIETLSDHQFPKSDIDELSALLLAIKTKTTKRKSGHTIVTKKQKERITVLLNKAKQSSDKISDKQQKSWLLQNIRIIEQYLEKRYSNRDDFMAENVLWLNNQHPDSRIIVSAHNGHINNRGNEMGSYLSKELKDKYTTFGFGFYQGTFTGLDNSMKRESLNTPQIAQKAGEGTLEYLLNSLDIPIFILDLKEIKRENNPLSNWLVHEVVKFRNTGAVALKREFWDAKISNDFDYLIFIRDSNGSKLINRN